VILQALKMLVFYSFVMSCFIGCNQVFTQGPDHFIQSSDLIVVRVERSHIPFLRLVSTKRKSIRSRFKFFGTLRQFSYSIRRREKMARLRPALSPSTQPQPWPWNPRQQRERAFQALCAAFTSSLIGFL
jgi:hypothetical protein